MHELIKKRRSPLAFSSQMIEQDQLDIIFEAGIWAASCFNEQPWRFIYATKDNEAEYNNILDCIVPGNQEWAQKAPILMITVAKTNFTQFDDPNVHAWHDVGMAMGNMSIQAISMDIYIHQMGGFISEKAIENLNIPDGYEPVAAVAMGYLGDPHELSDALRDRALSERTRKPFEELIFKDKWPE
ncbi:MAG: nitroreductase family protein [Bacteroidia bacterium]|nr:nitroreductase family protein [Bacteroidia bacterium]